MARCGSRTEHADGIWAAPGGPADLRFAYVLAADGSEDVAYVFGEWA
jgi:hypothetical protein